MSTGSSLLFNAPVAVVPYGEDESMHLVKTKPVGDELPREKITPTAFGDAQTCVEELKEILDIETGNEKDEEKEQETPEQEKLSPPPAPPPQEWESLLKVTSKTLSTIPEERYDEMVSARFLFDLCIYFRGRKKKTT
jgi:hypothetical protein